MGVAVHASSSALAASQSASLSLARSSGAARALAFLVLLLLFHVPLRRPCTMHEIQGVVVVSCLCRVSSQARARALCFAAASAILSDPHSALLALPALTDAHADDSLMHGALNSGLLYRKGPTGTRRVKGGVSGPAEDLRPVSEVESGVNFRPASQLRGQVVGQSPVRRPGPGSRRSGRRRRHTFPPPGGSRYPIRVTLERIGCQAIDGLDEGVQH